MADDFDDETEAEAEGEGEAKAGGSKKKLIIIAGGVVVLLAAAGGGAYFMGFLGGGTKTADGTPVVEEKPSIYFDMPEMVVNLVGGGRERAQYLKLKIALEADSQSNIDALQPKMPRIQDMFQIYLREMRRSDLEGSAAVYRLKQELMRRINIAIYPASVKRVLFKEIIVQ